PCNSPDRRNAEQPRHCGPPHPWEDARAVFAEPQFGEGDDHENGRDSSGPRATLHDSWYQAERRARKKATPRGASIKRGGASYEIPAATYSPTRKPCSTIGSGGLNLRVRDGNGWDPSDIATGNLGSALSVESSGTCIRARTRVRVTVANDRARPWPSTESLPPR